METGTISLNDGLVAIVGPKGSGKTAFANIIARGAGATVHDGSSFLIKAYEHLGDATVTVHWTDGAASGDRLAAQPDPDSRPYVRYLSQQFVDRLCSSDNLGRELLEEIEPVVYQAIAEEERLGAGSFTELRELRLEQVARARRTQLEDIQRYTELVAQEDQNKARLPASEKKLADLKAKIERDEKELARLLPKEKKAELARLAAVSSAIEAKTKGLQALALQAQRQAELARDHSLLLRKWGREFDELRARYQSCGLKDEEWAAFAPAFPQAEDVTSAFATAKSRTDQAVAALRDGAAKRDDKDLETWPLKELQALQTKLSTEIGVEKERAKKHTELMRKVGATKQERDGVQKEIEHVRGATTRRQEAITGRRQAYASVFDTLVQEEEVLNELYAPLKAQLAGEADVEQLELHVRRNVDVDAWVAAGEDLLDLRRSGPFQGHGSLLRVLSVGLAPAWRSGGAEEVATAMEEFINQNMGELMKARRADVTLAELGRWLFATDHVSLEYGLRYEGVDLAHLSPGMRGIVLLILYLAIDRWDTRLLLVDQPEENLDPHSVYEQLVRYFRAAKRRRQVIIVTHNPNLVVNADADQVIVATAERKDAKSLPTIRYVSGGLEDRQIRAEVCRILEGGERAFLDRERRYAIPRDMRTASRP